MITLNAINVIGIWLPKNQEIAMKFTPGDLYLHAEHEYAIYTWLGAVNNTKVEDFGIPSVYFYGFWNNHALMAITLLDSECHKMFKTKQYTEVDILIVFREFVSCPSQSLNSFEILIKYLLKVRTSKYIHSKGICHYDMTLDNIMFRKEQGFIIGK